jgi:hypothetical protein
VLGSRSYIRVECAEGGFMVLDRPLQCIQQPHGFARDALVRHCGLPRLSGDDKRLAGGRREATQSNAAAIGLEIASTTAEPGKMPVALSRDIRSLYTGAVPTR